LPRTEDLDAAFLAGMNLRMAVVGIEPQRNAQRQKGAVLAN
jgi:hypothetical protein